MKELKFNGNKMIIGPGSIQAIEGIEGQRFSIITGKRAMFDNGTIDGITGILKAQGKAYDVYSGIGANPTVAEVEEGAKRLKAFDPDVVLAVGGGSSIDAAKVMTLLCEYKTLTIEEIRNGKAPEARRKITLVAAPSTSGTASEVTRAAVVTFEDENIKVGLKTLAFIPDIAILDGNLTLSMPKSVVAETGMDALTHALESYINPNADDFCKPISRSAAEGLFKWLPLSFQDGDIKSRQKVHDFQSLAGMSFQNAGLGMSHGIAHAFGGTFGTGHGLLNAIALPVILAYNAQDSQVKADLDALGQIIGGDVIQEIHRLNAIFEIPQTFKEAGITEEEFVKHYDGLLAGSLKGSTARNPIPMDEKTMDGVLKQLYYGTERTEVE